MHPRRYPGKCRHGLDILHDYPIESKELLEKAQAGTLRLEEKPDDGEALASIFRAFHTIEGGAAASDIKPTEWLKNRSHHAAVHAQRRAICC